MRSSADSGAARALRSQQAVFRQPAGALLAALGLAAAPLPHLAHPAQCGGVGGPQGAHWTHNEEGRHFPARSRLTWSLEQPSSSLDAEQTRAVLREVFAAWSAASGLTFDELHEGHGDLRIAFLRGRHDAAWPGDDRPLEGDVAAHSFYPPEGVIHFNDALRWGRAQTTDVHDFQTFALHEVGHALGLDHAATGGAIMRSRPREGQHELSDDDRAGIAALYASRR